MASSAILKGKTVSSFHGNPCVPSGDDLCYTLEPGFGAQVEHEDISRSSRAVQSIPKMNGRSLSDVWQVLRVLDSRECGGLVFGERSRKGLEGRRRLSLQPALWDVISEQEF